MSAGVTFGPNGYSEAAGSGILNPTISEIIDQSVRVAGVMESSRIADELGFTTYTPLTPDEVFTSMRPITPAGSYGEGEVTPVKKRDESYRKSTKMVKFGAKISVSDEMLAWISSGKHIDGADSSVKRELMKLGNDVESAIQSVDTSKSILMSSILGFGGVATAAFGPGSAGGDDVALFADSHPNGGFAFDNNLATALDATNLLAAINAMKAFKGENGYLLKTASVYTLVVPRALESTARVILNSTSDQAGLYAGTGSNANLLNQFMFNGQRVELVVADYINQDAGDVLNYAGLSGTIGSATACYLLNKEELKKNKAFKFGALWDKKVETWREYDTGENFVKVSMYAMADHFGAAPFALKINA